MKRVYMCGPMTGMSEKEIRDYREMIMEEFAPYYIYLVDPYRNPLPAIDGSEDRYLVQRDFNDIRTCDAMFAYLSPVTQFASIGCMVEFGWASALNIPIVTVLPPSKGIYEHPFVKELSIKIVNTIEDGAYYINSLLEG